MTCLPILARSSSTAGKLNPCLLHVLMAGTFLATAINNYSLRSSIATVTPPSPSLLPSSPPWNRPLLCTHTPRSKWPPEPSPPPPPPPPPRRPRLPPTSSSTRLEAPLQQHHRSRIASKCTRTSSRPPCTAASAPPPASLSSSASSTPSYSPPRRTSSGHGSLSVLQVCERCCSSCPV